MDEKNALRRQMKELGRRLTDRQRGEWSAQLVSRLMQTDAVKEARVVMAFHPLASEPNLLPLLDWLLSEGKTVLLPIVTGRETLSVGLYSGAASLRQGPFGIMEPKEEADVAEWERAVALVPGLAFDRQGHRLGRGGGYYDRFLAPRARIYNIGIAMPYQLVDSVPAAPWDVDMNEVVLPSENIKILIGAQ